MTYQMNPTLWNGVFAIPNKVVDEHLRLCSGLALKVLLWILRNPGKENTAEALAAALRQAPADVADALNYWEEHGVLLKSGAPVPSAPPTPEKQESPAAIKPSAPVVLTRVGRPHYPREEAIALIDENASLTSLMDEGQTVMGKAFTSADMDSLVALYSYYGLSLHFILTAMHYCASIGKRSIGYVESVCVAWLNDGVTDETIGEYLDALRRRAENEAVIRREFGIGQRRLTAKEKAYIAEWFDTLHMPLELINLAYEKGVESTGKLSFSYIDKTLTAWSKKQISTLEEAEQESALFKETKEKKSRKNEKASKDEEKARAMQRLVDEFMND